MTGIPEYNYPAFDALAEELRSHGVLVLTPSSIKHPKLATGDAPYAYYLEEAIRKLLDANRIILMDGWHASNGARLEERIATSLGYPAYRAFRSHEGGSPEFTIWERDPETRKLTRQIEMEEMK